MRVVVVGAGVAGSATAVALRRVGLDVIVYEAYPDPAGQHGSFVSLAVNGLRALDRIGCLSAVQSAGFAVAEHRMWSSRGKLLATVPRGRRVGDPLQSVTLMRADLVAALRAEAVRLGARVVTGERMVEPRDPRLVEADLLVGADGLWSSVRGWLDPSASQPRYAGLYGVSGTSDRPDSSAPFAPGYFNMVLGGHGAFIYLPRTDGTVWWSAQISDPTPPDADRFGPETVAVNALSPSFIDDPNVAAVLGAARTLHGMTRYSVLAPVSTRLDSQTVLVGDAAHPVGAGQGASMALEDAVVLASRILCSATLPEALAGFDADRERRIGKMARMATTNRDAKTTSPLVARMRNLVMPLVFSRVYPRATGWLYDFELPVLPTAETAATVVS